VSATIPRAAFRLTGASLLAFAAISGCGGDGPADPPSATGAIQVTVSTSGADPDTDGYLATLDGTGPALTLPVTGASFINVPIGDHTVTLSGIASNCTVAIASRSVTVSDGATATVSFSISCSAIPVPPTAGSVRVVTSTIGDDPDLDGYQFAIDSGPAQTIGTSATATLNDIALGQHTVVFSGVASNCGIPNGWSKEVTVTGGDTANAVFPITCYAMGPSSSASHIQVDPATISITTTSIISVTVVDPSGTPLSGFEVSLNAAGTANTILPFPSGDARITDTSGTARFSFSSTVPETKTITATVNDVLALEDARVITVTKGSSFIGIISAAPEPSTAGEPVVVTVALGGERGTYPAGGTVAVHSNLEPDAGCDAAPVMFDGHFSSAKCEMSLSIVSTHLLNATYSGDSQYEGSSGTPVEHVVIAPEGAVGTASR
jgi:Bacterial Ig-like domain (group 1)